MRCIGHLTEEAACVFLKHQIGKLGSTLSVCRPEPDCQRNQWKQSDACQRRECFPERTATHQLINSDHHTRENRTDRTFRQRAASHQQNSQPRHSMTFFLIPAVQQQQRNHNQGHLHHIQPTGHRRTMHFKRSQKQDGSQKSSLYIFPLSKKVKKDPKHGKEENGRRQTWRKLRNPSQYSRKESDTPIKKWWLVSHIRPVIQRKYPISAFEHCICHDCFTRLSFRIKNSFSQEGDYYKCAQYHQKPNRFFSFRHILLLYSTMFSLYYVFCPQKYNYSVTMPNFTASN